MAYTTATLNVALASLGVAPTVWTYTTTDAHATVAGAGYFSDGVDKGLRVNDIVFVVDTDSATTTMHGVLNTTSINAATLA